MSLIRKCNKRCDRLCGCSSCKLSGEAPAVAHTHNSLVTVAAFCMFGGVAKRKSKLMSGMRSTLIAAAAELCAL